MRLLYICGYKFKSINGEMFTTPAYGEAFWEKYLDVFDHVDILGEEVREANDKSLIKLTSPRISVHVIPPNTRPLEIFNDPEVKKELVKSIKDADAILIKQASRKGNMAIHYAEKYNKPYMIELTGDLNIELKISHSILKKLYRPIIYHQVLKAIRHCQYGLYVTQEYLQFVYPIEGKQFGCTDTVLKDFDEDCYNNRIKRINDMNVNSKVIIGMIATYSGNRKGLDTAIEMLEKINNSNVELHILGRGTEDQREKWLDYAKVHNVSNQVFFDPPVPGGDAVLRWIDNTDIEILPSRAEGLPRCILEAMSRACPCITSNVCGLPELVEQKWTHDPGDSQELYRLVDSMINSKDDLINAARYNFEKSKKYDYDILNKNRREFLIEFKEYSERILSMNR